LLVAKEVKKLGDVPVIVAGDFNDVAWSHTTYLFKRIEGLLDPRVGRGLFNTFDTRSRLLRYPLDHVFASQHFLLVELRRLPDIGSDHFPMLVVLDYDPGASVAKEEPQPDAGDEQEADEVIEEGRSND
uniref:endonuclease/exonuclease/phosphatase family protein n=1 Tax=Aquisalimonas sp. TaxID=1872621 RepID=UPI0025BE47A7